MSCGAAVEEGGDAVEDELRGDSGEQHSQYTREDEDTSRANTLLNLRADAHGKPGGSERQHGGDGDGEPFQWA